MSIQTLNSQDFTAKTAPDFYDYIVVDEFHHAAGTHLSEVTVLLPAQILLGLTATPERMDGKSVLPYFGNRIAAEIRLQEAIDRKLLCPFQYFGVSRHGRIWNTLKWSGWRLRTKMSFPISTPSVVPWPTVRADLVVLLPSQVCDRHRRGEGPGLLRVH